MTIAIPNPGIIATAYGGGLLIPTPLATMWDILVVSAEEATCAIAEITMAATPGGANLCTGGTPRGNTVDNTRAFDGNTTTVSAGTLQNNNHGYRIGYEFASPVRPVEFTIRSPSNALGREAPRIFCLLCSFDSGATWTSVQFYFTTQWTAGETRTFAVPGTTAIADDLSFARIWRAKASSKSNGATTGYAGLSQMIWAGTPGGATLCLNGTNGQPFQNTNWSTGEGARNLTDGSTGGSNALTNAGSVQPYIWGYAWADPTIPVELRLYAPNNGGEAPLAPGSFDIEWSANGLDYHVTDSHSWGGTATSTQLKSFSVTP